MSRLHRSLPHLSVTAATNATNATPATVLAPAKVRKFAPMPTLGERISSFTGQRPLLVWILGLSGFGLLVSVVVMEIRRRIGTTQLGHRPATVTGPPLHDHEMVEEAPELQAPKTFRWWAAPDFGSAKGFRALVPTCGDSRGETYARTSNCSRPPNRKRQPLMVAPVNRTYVDFAESSIGPVIEQMPSNGETEVMPEVAAFASPVYDEHDEPAVSHMNRASVL